MNLQKDLKEFVASLNAKRVEFLVVGAHALAYHGHPRFTGDLDIALARSEENAVKVIEALHDFGFSDLSISLDDFQQEDRIVQLGVAPNRIDLHTSLSGITFEEAWADRIEAQLGDLPVHMISRSHLIANKRATGRPQDLADIASLEGDPPGST